MDKFKKVQNLAQSKVDNPPDERRIQRKRARKVLKRELKKEVDDAEG